MKIKILLFTFFIPLLFGVLLLVKLAAPDLLVFRSIRASWLAGAFAGFTAVTVLFGKWRYLKTVSPAGNRFDIVYYNRFAQEKNLSLDATAIKQVEIDNENFEKKKFGTVTITTTDGNRVKLNVIGDAMKEGEKLIAKS